MIRNALTRGDLARQAAAGLLALALLATPAVAGSVLYVGNNASTTFVSIPLGGGSPTAQSFTTSHISEGRVAAMGPDGNLWVSDDTAAAIHEYNPATGAWIKDFRQAAGWSPQQFAFDGAGNVLVADDANGTISRYNATTAVKDAGFSISGLANPRGLAFGPDGYLYTAAYTSATVFRYDVSGANAVARPGPSMAGANFITSGTGFGTPFGIAFYNGYIYAATMTNHTVVRYLVSTDVQDTGFVLQSGHTPGSGTGIAIDAASGTLFVVDQANSVIDEYNASTGAFLGVVADPSNLIQTPSFISIVTPVPEPAEALLLALGAVAAFAGLRARS